MQSSTCYCKFHVMEFVLGFLLATGIAGAFAVKVCIGFNRETKTVERERDAAWEAYRVLADKVGVLEGK